MKLKTERDILKGRRLVRGSSEQRQQLIAGSGASAALTDPGMARTTPRYRVSSHRGESAPGARPEHATRRHSTIRYVSPVELRRKIELALRRGH